jgi:hypothetical protein
MAAIAYSVYIDWDNDGTVDSGAFEANENVSANVLGMRTSLEFTYGRDTPRALSGIQPAEVSFELNNVSKIYSPDNASSALFGNLGPGKPVLIRATHSAVTYDLFRGFIDEYNIDPFREAKSVSITAVDILAKLGGIQVSTGLFSGIQTGTAIGKVLDAAGWSASKRDIDTGDSTVRWWWADDTTALEAIQDLVASEGPTAFAFVDPATGNFVFRGRNHRLLRSASITSQATFRDTGAEPLFSDPAEYSIGFRDLINTVIIDVDARRAEREQVVWETEDVINVAASSSVTIPAKADDPFYDAVVPAEADGAFTVQAGSVASVSLSRTSGASTTITVTAGASATVIDGMALRAKPVPVVRSYRIEASDSASIAKYGIQTWEESELKWVNRYDAQAIADLIIAQRAERLPVFTITVKNANDTRKVQMLSRALSDRVTIVEAETSTNNTHYIERITHAIESVGFAHDTAFACERTRTPSPSDTDIFILNSNVSGHRLDTGKLGG